MNDLHHLLDGASVDPAVFALRPDYRVLLIAVDGIEPGPSDAHSEQLLVAAEKSARAALAAAAVEDLPHINAWREAYRSFGAKPQRTRNSVEALTRRVEAGLPRVNRLTDIYNAISVLHQVPVGGEDLHHYAGSPRLIRADGTEPFDTTAGGNLSASTPSLARSFGSMTSLSRAADGTGARDAALSSPTPQLRHSSSSTPSIP